MATKKLFEEFPPLTTTEWEEAISRDLKDPEYQKKLVWMTAEGLAVKPYQRAEDIAFLAHLGGAPDQFPYLRGGRKTADWRIREEIEVCDPVEANRAALQAAADGAEEISFTHCAAKSAADLELLLANLRDVSVRFVDADEALLQLLAERMIEGKGPARASTGFDPLRNADFAAKLLEKLPTGLTPFTVAGAKLGESGAMAIEELGIILSAGIEALAAMKARGADPERAANAMVFTFSIGAKYFVEIAKLRAFRAIWAQAAASFGVTGEGAKARIYARTAYWNQAVYDPHVNVLRSTTEAMSAVLGGVDSLLVVPFDDSYRKPDSTSRRLARNTQILLKQEAMLGRVADPGGGAYSIEFLTDYLGREAWKLMQKIEASGGYTLFRAAGGVAEALAKSMSARRKAVASRKRVYTGVNKYADFTEKALDRVDAARVASRERGTSAYELLRLRTERAAARTGKTPRILLAEIGDAKMRAARSGFASNFFACAGFEVKTQRFKSTEEIAAIQSDVIVLCSSDPEYLALVTELASRTKTPIVVAGAPENSAELSAAGAADFIHVRSNPIEVLAAWQRRLGIEG